MVQTVGGVPTSFEWPEKPPRPCKVVIDGKTYMAGRPERVGDYFKVPLLPAAAEPKLAKVKKSGGGA